MGPGSHCSRRRRRGSTNVEQICVVLGLALVGVGGLRTVGEGFRRDLRGPGRLSWGWATAREAATGSVCATGPQVPGIDVSRHQDTIQWDAVKQSGQQFAFIRVSDGLDHPDGQFDRNWSEAKRVGILRGAYQYFRPGQDPIAQAKLFVAKVGTLGPDDLPPVLDLEGGGNENVPGDRVIQAALQWVQYVEQATGKRPMIYTGHYYWKDNLAENPVFKDFLLWVPNYSAPCPLVPNPWQNWAFFQHTDAGRVPGIEGGVDMNLFNGDAAALTALARASSVGAQAVPEPAAVTNTAAAPVVAIPRPLRRTGKALLQYLNDGMPHLRRVGYSTAWSRLTKDPSILGSDIASLARNVASTTVRAISGKALRSSEGLANVAKLPLVDTTIYGADTMTHQVQALPTAPATIVLAPNDGDSAATVQVVPVAGPHATDPNDRNGPAGIQALTPKAMAALSAQIHADAGSLRSPSTVEGLSP